MPAASTGCRENSMRRLLALLLAAAPLAHAGDPIEISMPVLGAIYRFDPDTGALTPFCTGLGMPFYGTWADDGFLYMPDRLYGVIWRISEAGEVHPLAAGGWLGSVRTLVVPPHGSLVAGDIFSEGLVRPDPHRPPTPAPLAPPHAAPPPPPPRPAPP